MRTARFVATLFVSATLLFSLQPMVARMIVPLLGGAPSVWIVCSLCFQALLLSGYCYAHVVGSRLSVRTQVVLQLALVLAAFFVLPVAVSESAARWAEGSHPTMGLILILLSSVGLPFFVLSTTSPLVQRWFAEMGEQDPYYLYVASNAGSMLALLGYPFVLEPLLSVHAQSRAVYFGYVLYALLVAASGVTTIRMRRSVRADATPAPPGVSGTPRSDPPASRVPDADSPAKQRLTWIALAFAPSSLLLGATEYITTDLASVPLLWVVPLALYLGSFIVAFSKKPLLSPSVWSRALALVTAIVAAMMLADLLRPAWLVVGAHLLLVFLSAVVCHQALAARRPPVVRLTEFYLLMSIGGVLGGAFNGLVAPFVFDDLVEYPLAIGLVCLARLYVDKEEAPEPRRDVALGLGLGVATFVLVKIGTSIRANPDLAFVWMFALPILVAFTWSKRPLRYALAVGGILLAGLSYGGAAGQVRWRDRNFFGVLKVSEAPSGRYRMLVYGKTMHGQQSLDPADKRVPLAYYHPTGPVGDVLSERVPGKRVGVIGLGIGSLAAYAQQGDHWTFFEINPAVVEVARTQFSFLADVPEGTKVDVEVGDARLRLRQGDAARFDVLVLDAFSSDAIPIHLVTRQAIEIYRRALAPGGVLLAHVSNRHVRLQPVFGALAANAGMIGIERRDLTVTPELRDKGKATSEWVVLTMSDEVAKRIAAKSSQWKPLEAPPGQAVWSDDFANVLGAMRF